MSDIASTSTETAVRSLLDRLSPPRRRHSLGVARCARLLALRFGFDADQAYWAGLAHDVARELPHREILSLAARAGREATTAERLRPLLLHGAAGAALLRERGVDDPVILCAVDAHVGGRPGLSAVAKAVYAADLLEPGRRFARSLRRSAWEATSLDAVVLLVADALQDYYRSLGEPPLEETRRMIEELRSAG